MSGIAALAYIGVFDFSNFLTMPNFVKAIAFVVIFLALFLFVFCLLNIKRGSSRKKKKAAAAADASAGVTRHQNGLLATGLLAAASQRHGLSPSGVAVVDETSVIDVIYEKNGVPYINSDLAKRNNQGTLNNNFVKLVESVKGSS